MWRTRLARTWDWIRSRRLVGEDEHHLYYSEFVAKGKSERRYVEYKDRDITQSSDRMPIEWWSWLHNRRDAEPTPDEIALSERKQQNLAERVAILEAEDEKQRLRQYAGSNQYPARAERRAARRRDVLESLAKAASPDQQSTEGITLASTAHVKKSRDGVSERNIEEDPKVRQTNSLFPSPEPGMASHLLDTDPVLLINFFPFYPCFFCYARLHQGGGEDFQPGSWSPQPSRRRRQGP